MEKLMAYIMLFFIVLVFGFLMYGKICADKAVQELQLKRFRLTENYRKQLRSNTNGK